MSNFDLALGAKVLVSNANWKQASILTKAAALLFGRKESFDHLDVTVQIRWWRDQPYLVGIKEAQS
jgi:hypothetical protein